jgi:hypothetical protein
LATCARDLSPVSEETYPACRAARTCIAAVGEFEWTNPLDEAIRLVGERGSVELGVDAPAYELLIRDGDGL